MIYTIEYAPTEGIPRSYDGMSEETVLSLITIFRNPTYIVDEATYNAAVKKVAPQDIFPE